MNSNMKNSNFFSASSMYEVKIGDSFVGLLQKLSQGMQEQVVFFTNELGDIFALDSQSSVNQFVWPVTKIELGANLLNVFTQIMQTKIADFFIEDGFCWVKFLTNNSYSKKDFEQYKNLIKNFKDMKTSENTSLHDMCAGFLNFLPYDFQIENVAQEYFNGNKVQKFSFALFFSQEMKQRYIENVENLKLDDHRYIGLHQNLFMTIPEAVGSIFWLPKGWLLFRNLENFIRVNGYIGYNEVKTPFVMSNKFWERSGHLASFKQNMMFVTMGESKEDDSALKPMSCPAHIEIFKQKNRSYRDLPFRLAEFGCCHRYEPSGSLHGLMRVRSLTQDDGHIFCSLDQIKNETSRFLETCIYIYKKLGFDNIRMVLATKPENALGDSNDWVLAEEYLKESLINLGIEFEIALGEGAFYGPKIEMHITDSLKRSWQLGTIQLDFVLPERFELEYVKSDGLKGRVCMLHRAILGSLERFMGVLLEHCHGKIPLFLAPVQVFICTITSEVDDYARFVMKKMQELNISVVLDDRNEKLQAKIRESRLLKIPMLAVIGKKEMEQKFIKIQYNNVDYIYKTEELLELKRLIDESK